MLVPTWTWNEVCQSGNTHFMRDRPSVGSYSGGLHFTSLHHELPHPLPDSSGSPCSGTSCVPLCLEDSYTAYVSHSCSFHKQLIAPRAPKLLQQGSWNKSIIRLGKWKGSFCPKRFLTPYFTLDTCADVVTLPEVEWMLLPWRQCYLHLGSSFRGVRSWPWLTLKWAEVFDKGYRQPLDRQCLRWPSTLVKHHHEMHPVSHFTSLFFSLATLIHRVWVTYKLENWPPKS